MPESTGGGWAWDVSLVVGEMSMSARAEFLRELRHCIKLAPHEEDWHPGRTARFDELHDALALRAAMNAQVHAIITNSTIERDDQ